MKIDSVFIQYWDNMGRTRGWLRYCATSRKVAGSIPDEVIGFPPPPQFTESFQLHYGPEVDLAANRNEYQESSGG
jgi:hypothetical protein